MRKILETILSIFDWSKADIDLMHDLLSRHLTVYAAFTVGVLFLTVLVPILFTRPIADWFDRRAKANARDERTQDVVLACYHEMAQDIKAALVTFDLPMLESILKKMRMEQNYFPLWTFSEEQLYLFDRNIKEDVTILPSNLIGHTLEFYQTAFDVMAYYKGSQLETTKALPLDRRIAFLQNMYDTALEHLQIGCKAIYCYEQWLYERGLHKKGAGYQADFGWLKSFSEIRITDGDLDYVTGRLKAYRKIGDFASEARRRVAVISAAPTPRPGGGLDGGLSY